MRSNRGNNESMGMHQNGHKTYCHMATGVVSLPYGNNERIRNDGGRTSSIPQRARVEPSQAQAERERIPICSEVDARREIHRASYKVRPDYRGPSTREAGKGEIKDKASTTGWPAIAKKIIAVARSNRRQPGKLMRDGPSESLPFFSIHTLSLNSKALGNVLCIEIWVCVESLCVSMKSFSNPFNFKAIETKYDGYKFRSRLEARWAVFFNTLGIPYEYEKEGYDLEGTWYLPDFWLPEQDCWVEVKGQRPTEEEFKKAKDLALYTDKSVYIAYGNIGLPDHKNTHAIRLEHPPYIWLDNTPISASLDARIAIQRLADLGMEFGIRVYDKLGKLLTMKRISSQGIALDWFESEIESDIQNLHKLRDLIPFIRKCEKELIEIFSQTTEDKEVYVITQEEGAGALEWVTCDNCLAIHIKQIWVSHNIAECYDCKHGILTNKSPRLLAAYEAARQARF